MPDAPGRCGCGLVAAAPDAALSLLVMPTVSLPQRRAGAELGSGSAVADSKQTLLCSHMSGVLLANSLAGWWWADALGALAIAALAVREGLIAWRGDSCFTPLPVPVDEPAEPADQPAVVACASGCACTRPPAPL